MPYIETSMGGDPATSWKHAEHVFRTVARLSHRIKEDLGRYRPPETLQAQEEPEDAQFLEGASFAAGSFIRASRRRKPLVASHISSPAAASRTLRRRWAKRWDRWSARQKAPLQSCR